MIFKYNEFINEKLSDKLSGFDNNEIIQQLLNKKIDFRKYIKLQLKYNLKPLTSEQLKYLLDNYMLSLYDYCDYCDENDIKPISNDEIINYINYTNKEFPNYEIHQDPLLICASKHNNMDLFNYAIQHDANIHYSDEAALKFAVFNNNYEMTEILLKQGADQLNHLSSKFNNLSEYPIAIAIKNKNYDIIKLLLHYNSELLYYVFYDLCANNNIEMIKYFIEQGAKLFSSSLFYAIRKNKYDIIKLLLENGIKVDKTCLTIDTTPEIKELLQKYYDKQND